MLERNVAVAVQNSAKCKTCKIVGRKRLSRAYAYNKRTGGARNDDRFYRARLLAQNAKRVLSFNRVG